MRFFILGILVFIGAGCSHSTKYSVDPQSASSFDGIWTNHAEPNTTFTIQGDTLAEIEHPNKARFLREGDRLIIYYPGDTLTAAIYKTHADTLVYVYADQKSLYWRVNP